MRTAGWLSLAGHRGGAVWRHLTPTVEGAPLYMQMKPKDPSVPLDMVVQNSEKSGRTLVAGDTCGVRNNLENTETWRCIYRQKIVGITDADYCAVFIELE